MANLKGPSISPRSLSHAIFLQSNYCAANNKEDLHEQPLSSKRRVFTCHLSSPECYFRSLEVHFSHSRAPLLHLRSPSVTQMLGPSPLISSVPTKKEDPQYHWGHFHHLRKRKRVNEMEGTREGNSSSLQTISLLYSKWLWAQIKAHRLETLLLLILYRY